jgi:hypothetical protein
VRLAARPTDKGPGSLPAFTLRQVDARHGEDARRLVLPRWLAAQTGQRLRLRESSNDGWIALALAPEHHDKIAARALAGVMEATGLRLTEDEAVARGEMMG